MNSKLGLGIGGAAALILAPIIIFVLLLSGPDCGTGDAGTLSEEATADIPANIVPMYVKAARRWNIDVAFLASIGGQETNHGRHPKTHQVNSAGCAGLMQLGTGGRCLYFWVDNKCDGDGDGRMDVMNDWDNICAAAKGLRKEKGAPPAGGSEEAYYQAACRYYGRCTDASANYAPEIMARAKLYGFVGGTATDADALPVSDSGAGAASCAGGEVASSEKGERAAQIAAKFLGKDASATPFDGFKPPTTGSIPWCAWFLTNIWKQVGIKIEVDWWSGGPYTWAAQSHPDQLVKRVGQPATTLKLPPGTALMYGSSPTGDSDHVNMVRKLNADGTVMVIGGNQGNSRVTAYGPCRLRNGSSVYLSGPGCDPRPIYGIVLPTPPSGDSGDEEGTQGGPA